MASCTAGKLICAQVENGMATTGWWFADRFDEQAQGERVEMPTAHLMVAMIIASPAAVTMAGNSGASR